MLTKEEMKQICDVLIGMPDTEHLVRSVVSEIVEPEDEWDDPFALVAALTRSNDKQERIDWNVTT